MLTSAPLSWWRSSTGGTAPPWARARTSGTMSPPWQHPDQDDDNDDNDDNDDEDSTWDPWSLWTDNCSEIAACSRSPWSTQMLSFWWWNVSALSAPADCTTEHAGNAIRNQAETEKRQLANNCKPNILFKGLKTSWTLFCYFNPSFKLYKVSCIMITCKFLCDKHFHQF